MVGEAAGMIIHSRAKVTGDTGLEGLEVSAWA